MSGSCEVYKASIREGSKCVKGLPYLYSFRDDSLYFCISGLLTPLKQGCTHPLNGTCTWGLLWREEFPVLR